MTDAGITTSASISISADEQVQQFEAAAQQAFEEIIAWQDEHGPGADAAIHLLAEDTELLPPDQLPDESKAMISWLSQGLGPIEAMLPPPVRTNLVIIQKRAFMLGFKRGVEWKD